MKAVGLLRVVLGICLVSGMDCVLRAQTSATNRVLELDGKGSYVELPPNLFADLEEATVEGWLKWEDFVYAGRFFDFGTAFHDMAVHEVRACPKYVCGE